MTGDEARLADELFDEMRKLANRLEDEKDSVGLPSKTSHGRTCGNEYCLLVYEDVW